MRNYLTLRFSRNKRSRYKFNMQNCFFLLIIVVFLTPQCIDYLIPHSRIVIYCLRIISLTFFLLVYKVLFPGKKDRELYYLTIFIMTFGSAQSIAEMLKTGNPLSLRFIVFYTGFSLVVITMLKEKPNEVLNYLLYVLSIYNIIQLLTVIIYYPQGMTPELGTDSSKAVYFFGGKNQAFVFMLLLLLLLTIKGILDKGKISKFISLVIIVFAVEGYVLDSMATVVCLILLALGYALAITKRHRIFRKLLNPYILLLIIGVIFGVFCIANSLTDFSRTSSIAKVLYRYNRNLTFTGRTFLWQQAINMFMKNPIIGSSGEFSIVGINLDQAHNAFLDILSKYGLISFIPFLMFVFCIAKNLNRIKENKRIYIICSISFFTLLFHCCFEYMDMYALFTFAFIIVAIKKDIKQLKLKTKE